MKNLITTSGIHPHHRKLVVLILFFTGMALLGIGQDFLNSRVNESAFYLSESSLYKVIWILFLPLLYFLWPVVEKTKRTGKINIWGAFILIALVFTLAHLWIAALLIYLLSYVLLDHFYTPDRVFRYFFSEEFYIVLIIYGLAIFYIRKRLHSSTLTEKSPAANPPDFLRLKNGGIIRRIAVEDIQYITTDRPYIAILTADRKHLHSCSLRELQSRLDQSRFVRIHRSFIVNLDRVAQIESRANGDYDVHMENGDTVRLSRNYAADFKKRLESHTQLSV